MLDDRVMRGYRSDRNFDIISFSSPIDIIPPRDIVHFGQNNRAHRGHMGCPRGHEGYYLRVVDCWDGIVVAMDDDLEKQILPVDEHTHLIILISRAQMSRWINVGLDWRYPSSRWSEHLEAGPGQPR